MSHGPFNFSERLAGLMDAGSPPRPARRPAPGLRQFGRPRPQEGERCELCSAPLGKEHQHLLEPAGRSLACACDACAILFSTGPQTRYRRVPHRKESWPGFNLSDEQWAGLGIPINLAFFYRSTQAGQVVAAYPSPGGATESLLPGEAWDELVRDNPALASLEADVEALLVNRIGGARQTYRVGIDECYKLVGLIRTHWRGISGGAKIWGEIARYFGDLDAGALRRANA